MFTNYSSCNLSILQNCRTLLLLVLLTLTRDASAQADLVPGLGDLGKDMNNATQFNPSVRTLVTVAYRDPNLPLGRFIQLGFRTTSETPLNIASIAWSFDNVNFTPFAATDSIDNIDSPSEYRYSPIIDLGRFIGGPPAIGFYLRYIIPSGLKEGTIVQSKFLANRDGYAENGVLAENVGNSFVSLTRLHTAIPEPTSIFLTLTAATSFLGIKLFRRFRQKASRSANGRGGAYA